MPNRYDPFSANYDPSRTIRTPEKTSRLKDALYAGALVVAAVAFPAYGAMEGHTTAERIHSEEMLQAEGLAALAALDVAAVKVTIDRSRSSAHN